MAAGSEEPREAMTHGGRTMAEVTDVAIVGAGLAGLACGCELAKRALSCVVLEASDRVGGRARTDEVNGFLLDRGFQVLLTEYPEAKRLLDYPALRLQSFEPGALVRVNGKFHRVADPWRRPSEAMSTLMAPIGSVSDKLALGKLRRKLTEDPKKEDAQGAQISTLQYLRNFGFSSEIIDTFFRPFLGGVFLERELQTSSRMFEFLFRMFSLGEASLPAKGMGALAEQLAARLPSIRLQQKAVQVTPTSVALASGETVSAKAVVVATDQGAAAELVPGLDPPGRCGTTCFYFAAVTPPVSEPVLVLNGEGRGPINHFCVPSVVARSYAPMGRHLISANSVGGPYQDPAPSLEEVREQMVEWFGQTANTWEHLRTDWIPNALPDQTLDAGGVRRSESAVQSGIFVCGDYREAASINGALVSGRKTAEAIAQSLGS